MYGVRQALDRAACLSSPATFEYEGTTHIADSPLAVWAAYGPDRETDESISGHLYSPPETPVHCAELTDRFLLPGANALEGQVNMLSE